MLRLFRVRSDEHHLVEPLCALLIDAVRSGASVGFLAPLAHETAARYWHQVLSSVGDHLCVWIAELDGKVVGSVQLALCEKENGSHRAEIQKLFVLRSSRGQGTASKLMAAAEEHARACGPAPCWSWTHRLAHTRRRCIVILVGRKLAKCQATRRVRMVNFMPRPTTTSSQRPNPSLERTSSGRSAQTLGRKEDPRESQPSHPARYRL